MVSVERVAAYGDLPSEAPTVMELDSEHPNWPSDASISLENITVRYQKDLTPALKNVTVTIKGGEKVGVVGR
jgi:ABC-type multidrug transport system fused ATPase/permease subunit